MCNAWNHPINCRCGWGGEGHLGRSSGTFGLANLSLSAYADWAKRKYRSDSEGYTTPNAQCPVCKASVYFYQSPEGGRVFFDDLGPPWPKHPCTDNRTQIATEPGSKQSITSSEATRRTTRCAWKEEKWAPFICDSFAVVPPGACAAIGGFFDDGHVVLFVREKSFVVRAPYQLKKQSESTYLLSTVQYQSGAFKVYKVIAFRHLKDAIAAGKLELQAALTKPNAPSPGDRHGPAKPTAVGKPTKKRLQRIEGAQSRTAMELAFEKANMSLGYRFAVKTGKE